MEGRLLVNKLFDDMQAARVLAFGAHPDDVEVGAGGLVARLADEGADVLIAVVSVPTLLERRKAEAEEAARRLGARCIVLHPEAACRVEDIHMYDLVRRFDHVIGDHRPSLVITHAESDLHWDHGLVNRATISALRRTSCDLLAYQSSFQMNAQTRSFGQCFADISETIETKVHAIAAHESQMGKPGSMFDLDSTRDLARAMGRIAGVRHAECYEVLRLRI
jgi:LmbE family N-acetylglucosaminyl deacetylase